MLNSNRKTIVKMLFLSGLISPYANAIDFKVNETDVSVYGYAKLDVIYDVNDYLGNSTNRGGARLSGAPGSDGHTRLHAYESRVGFSTATLVEGSLLKTKLEGDFYGNGGGDFRLRHAYGEWQGLLAGKTWTNFTGLVAVTPLVDFTGPGGRPRAARQAQLRYTMDNFSFSMEDPEEIGGLEDAPGAKSSLPDVTARYTDRSGRFGYSLSAVARSLEYDSESFSAVSSSDSAFGWGLAAEAAWDVTSALTLRAGYAEGDGMGGYINGGVNPSPAYVNEGGDLETIRTSGGTLGASLKAGPGNINAAYSLVSADLDSNPAYLNRNESFEEAWLNYIWSPATPITYGVEVGWHRRETVNGAAGDAARLQGMVKYAF